MKKEFKVALKENLILADGAIGTELYNKGFFVNRNFDLLNIEAPDSVLEIHQAYVESGARLIETNTFGATKRHLTGSGAGNRVREVNMAAVALAKKAVGDNDIWIAGSMGPTGLVPPPFGKGDEAEIVSLFKEQAEALIEGGVDLIMIETIRYIREAELAVEAVREVSKDIGLGVLFTFNRLPGGQYFDITPIQCAEAMAGKAIDFIGINCSGPRDVLESLQQLRSKCHLPVMVAPNAGRPQEHEGRTMYMATPEYMGEYAMRFADNGASIIGGCCGTTPKMIEQMHRYLKSKLPSGIQIKATEHERYNDAPLPEIPLSQKSKFAADFGKKFQVSVELALPKGLDPTKAVEGAKILRDNGIDIVNIPDGPRAMARTSPMSLAILIKQQLEMEAIVHYCCRDRNLLGMQMDLIGAQMLGIHNLLIITGDPPKMGNAPDASPVFDVDSIGLLKLASNLNKGLDIAGKSLGSVASLVLGTGCNPGSEFIEKEVKRFGHKITAGAEYVFSQPVYKMEFLTQFLDDIKDLPKIQFFAGILPLASMRNAEFLHNEVPGMQIPDEILKRMGARATKEGQREEGIAIAREMLAQIKEDPRVDGVYIFPPFGNYESVLKIVDGIL